MKVLYIEDSIEGHHVPYLKALISTKNHKSIVITPYFNQEIDCKQIVYKRMDFSKKNFIEYCLWIIYIKRIAKQEKIDIIHFLDGDSIMRYFGFGFSILDKYRIVITFHHYFEGKLRQFSYKRMCHGNRVCVVHTDEVKRKLEAYNITNINLVEYPAFGTVEKRTKDANLPKVVGALGGTRYDKGLDILLKALQKVNCDFQLIIAGQEYDFGEDDIKELIEKYRNRVTIKLKFLTQKEFDKYINSADIIVLPYRKIFDGASGLLTEGAFREKRIIGPSHGSLYKLITEWHLGDVFESENIESLSKTIEYALTTDFIYDEVAKEYVNRIGVETFRKRYLQIYMRKY